MRAILVLFIIFVSSSAYASFPGLPALTVTSVGNEQTYSLSLQVLVIMTMLTLLPSLLIMMTSFTRIVIVLAILRQAMGMPQTPTNQVIIGIALFLSLFIMTPVFNQINSSALQPYMKEKISAEVALTKASVPIKSFMLKQTRKNDLNVFYKVSGKEAVEDLKDIPLSVLIPAFITSELKTAFQIGFILFLPFLVIDLVVASVLMAMGMMMLSPLIISLPFKVMLFVLVDGWVLVLGTLAKSFGAT